MLSEDMREAILRLDRLGEGTKRPFERDYGNESWFEEWDAMVESIQAVGAVDEGKMPRSGAAME